MNFKNVIDLYRDDDAKEERAEVLLVLPLFMWVALACLWHAVKTWCDAVGPLPDFGKAVLRFVGYCYVVAFPLWSIITGFRSLFSMSDRFACREHRVARVGLALAFVAGGSALAGWLVP